MSTQWKSPAAKNGKPRAFIRPDLTRPQEGAHPEIVPANMRALEILYGAAMLEEAGLFDARERLTAMFSQGLLPVSGPAGGLLYRSWRANPPRFSTAQRQTVYARAFGFPGHDADVIPNREFNDLWVRLLSTVGMYAAELQLPPAERSVSQEEVRRAGRDLALNLSAHGQGITWFAAQELKHEIQELTSLLSSPEILSAFGAITAWEVIERVATSGPGRRPNIPRSRARAESGRIVVRWLANHAKQLLRAAPSKILKDDDLRKQRAAASEEKRQSHPTDYDLLNACEQWLAVTGTQEMYLEE